MNTVEQYTLQRYESYRGRTTPEIEWRVWNPEHSSFVGFRTKRDAVIYLAACNAAEPPSTWAGMETK